MDGLQQDLERRIRERRVRVKERTELLQVLLMDGGLDDLRRRIEELADRMASYSRQARKVIR